MTQPTILKHMLAVADATRVRMLRILAGQELTVSEIGTVLQLPQSTVSRHLKILLDDGWVSSRRDGTSRFYSLTDDLAADARGLWALVQEQAAELPAAARDSERLESVLASRRSKAREFFSASAEHWDRLRDELYGAAFPLQALLGLLDERWVVGDLGCGTGHLTQLLAPHVGSVVAVDGSAEMLETAARRLEGVPNVDLRQGELEALPVESAALDAAILMLVLHYVPDPGRVLSEARRALRPGGKLLIVDMLPHDREEYQQQMGHVWLGFSEPQTGRALIHAGFDRVRYRPLPPAPDAQGPGLFAATAVR